MPRHVTKTDHAAVWLGTRSGGVFGITPRGNRGKEDLEDVSVHFVNRYL
jgi:hypothetical protein